MKNFIVCCLCLCVVSAGYAAPISVGSGEDWAGVRIEWDDGYAAEFLVSFEGGMTGMGLLDIIASETALIITKQDYGFGEFVDGFSFEDHSNIGYGGDEDWWHYYTKDAGQLEWTASWVGASSRVVSSGDWDGWSYGHAIPEPATMAIFGLGFVLLCRKRI
jgi:hypothetical protein